MLTKHTYLSSYRFCDIRLDLAPYLKVAERVIRANSRSPSVVLRRRIVATLDIFNCV
ncbi:MAG: hypothetical protein US18_C0045G0004 [Parcubacteria group bacterium GW2011_GWB1_36_5]|uniref:Uncharacterized protein n=1 Tax=Candidatus Daviesbacteria bacterium GW2011_GWA2_38_24 TaxID=1618422 RepID=A0A0G0JFD7_9BACT|nr:MAG: hypothetical protein US18_C0045G0004 [Parcubacteria group bacterium GW2011_GWB1_36_5]KKQ66383.1 MAG: hypothetical protein US86_C0006G0063 [Candidatus Daviesbacteria bacterium GW2011_GWA2_38_24]